MRNITDAEYLAGYELKRAVEQSAFDARGGHPPRKSRVNGPPADWKRWCALLDGVPVNHCYAFDVDEGWVEVYVVQEKDGRAYRLLGYERRRLYGHVDVIAVEVWFELRNRVAPLEVWTDDLRGEPVPGTAMERGKPFPV